MSALATWSYAIFSFDRGGHLLECVDSIERFDPGSQITIYDGKSTDPETLSVLRRLGLKHRVVVDAREQPNRHLGGLYDRMNDALGDAQAKGGTALVFFVQDDFQIVRPIDAHFRSHVSHAFAGTERLIQVSPYFLKGFEPALEERFSWCKASQVYFSENSGISDVGIMHGERLAKIGFQFGNSENETTVRLWNQGYRLGISPWPVGMFMPWPDARRPLRSPLAKAANALRDWCLGAGVNPFFPWREEQTERFQKRDPQVMPIAELWLESVKSLRTPWWYTSSFDSSLFKGANLLKLTGLTEMPKEYTSLVSATRARGRLEKSDRRVDRIAPAPEART